MKYNFCAADDLVGFRYADDLLAVDVKMAALVRAVHRPFSLRPVVRAVVEEIFSPRRFVHAARVRENCIRLHGWKEG